MAVGSEFTTTAVVAVAEHPLVPVTVIVYVPAWAVVTADLTGLCSVELKVAGPDHEYEVCDAGPPVRFRFCPAQSGEFDEAVAEGLVLTVTATVAVFEHPLELVAVMVYVPACVVATEDLTGLCVEAVNVAGPVQE